MAGELFAWVEDEPSAAAARVLVRHTNRELGKKLAGFPAVTRGYGNIKEKLPSHLEMAKNGIPLLIITDLDRAACPPELIRNWLKLPPAEPFCLPRGFLFRVAVRELEAWLLADRERFSEFLKISPQNFPARPETLDDPKQHLLNVLRRKGRKRWHKDMLPEGPAASVGPRYNEKLCEFIDAAWDPARAADHAPSLARALRALATI